MDLRTPAPPHPTLDEEITLAEYFGALRAGRWAILTFVAACTLAGLAAGLLRPTRYTASIVVAPVSSSPTGGQMGGVGGLISQFGGLASLAGISLGEDAKRAETLAVLESSALTERYIAQNNLLPTLYPKLWNPTTRRWRTSDPNKVPTLWKANAYFTKKIRLVSIDAKTGIVTMQITWIDPKQAAIWANGLVSMTNDYLRTQAIAEAQRNIDYLNDQGAKTTVVSIKDVIYNILENEINKEMLARGTREYALKVLDPAQPPERPSSLPPIVLAFIGFVGGLGLSLLLTFFRIVWGRSD
jgi:uncharacterized protein involved in exopolysaccharide biosynthesis